jgi:hypothetical protein
MKYLLIFAVGLLWIASGAAITAQTIKTDPRLHRRATLDPKRPTSSTIRIADKKKAEIFKPQIIFRPDLIRTAPGRATPTTPTHTGTPSSPATPAPAPVEEVEEDPDAYLEFQPEGPSSSAQVNLESVIQEEVLGVNRDALGIDTRILRDANSKSGFYYYFPREYQLGWSKVTGKPDITITFQEATGNSAGLATVTATLYPKQLPGDVEIARDMLAKKLANSPGSLPDIHEFTDIPMTQAPMVEFESLTQFGVTADNIGLHAPSRLGDPVKIIFTTSKVDVLLAMFFNNVGVFGNLIVYTNGFENGFAIPLNLKIDAPETYGAFEVTGTDWRNTWRNPTDYPVSIGHLHVLRKEPKGDYRIYSWKADNELVPPGAKVNFGASSIPTWVENNSRVKRIWMDYAINECDECDKAVKKKVLESINQNGVAKPEKLEFTILTPMAFTEASLIRIKVRSFQASASGDEKTELESVTVKEDGDVLDGGTLYVRDGKVDYEYKMVVYLEDGTTYESGWIPSNSKEVVIGSRQIRDNIPEFNE